MQHPPPWGPGYGPPNQQHPPSQQWHHPSNGYPPPSGHGYGPPPPAPPPKTNYGLIGAIVGGGLLLMVISAAVGDPKKDAGSTNAAAPAGEPAARKPAQASQPAKGRPAAAPAVQVEARKLFDDYQSNEVAADELYKGKELLVRGKVESIDKDFMGDIIVRLQTSNQFMSAMASMEDSEKGRAARLAKGQSVAVRCTGRGIVIGTPSLGDCTFAD